MINYYTIDTETTGLSVKNQEVVEISIIRCSDRRQLSRTIRAETPETASYDALKITGKTLADLYNGDSKEDAVTLCNKFFEEDGGTPASRCIIGHNIISFDKKFLHALWEKCGSDFPASLWLDTLQMMRQYAKDKGMIKPKLGLEPSCDIFGIKKVAGSHTAKGDVRNNYFLYNKIIESGFDYLPFIKTFPHNPIRVSEEDVNDLLAEMDSY